MIEIIDLHLTLENKHILKGINLSIPDTRNTVVIGKSGCGKTMLMKTIEGLYKETSGHILIDGIEPVHTNLAKRDVVYDQIAMLFQNAALLDSFNVFQNVSLPLFERKQKSAEEIFNIAHEVLNLVGLENSSNLYPSELSGGMRKRIGLARALVTNPKYLILDEPTTGLDPITAGEVLAFLKLVIKEKKIVPLTITHDPYCIKELGDYIIIMEDGKILFSGIMNEIEKYADKSVRDFYQSFFN